MKQLNVLYIHGFGGSGKGGFFNGLKAALDSKAPGKINLLSRDFDLLNPEKCRKEISDFIESNHIDIVLGQSLGGFYASHINFGGIVVLTNLCLFPENVIPKIDPSAVSSGLASEWSEMNKNRINLTEEHRERFFGVFAKNDQYFSYADYFKKEFGREDGTNIAWVQGGHEMLKNKDAVSEAVGFLLKYLDN